jgi:hypothetical protein
MTLKQNLLRRIAISRGNLLLMTILTIANIISYWFEWNFMLPFSAFLPFTIFDFGYFFSIELADPSLFIAGIVLSALVLLLYFLGYLLSKKKPGWLTAMLGLYIFDTIVMVFLYTSVFMFDGSMILDVLFHVWVLYYLINGVLAVKKLKNLPEEFEELSTVETV